MRTRRLRLGARAASLAALALLATTRAAHADEITVWPSRDTTLFEEVTTNADGAGSYVFTGMSSKGQRRRALVAFDVASALPAGTKITAVKLGMFLSRAHPGDAVVALHRVTADWSEGGSDAPGNEGAGTSGDGRDATWSHRVLGAFPWATPGGDFATAESASTTVGLPGAAYVWSSSTMLSDVRAWHTRPDTNHGWIVVAEGAGAGVAKRFGSSEGAPSERPELRITYDAPSEPSGACCEAEGSCTIRLAPGTACSGSFQGAGTTCAAATCPPPRGACCHPDVTAACEIGTETACASLGGTWLGAATTCGDGACPVVLTPFVDALPIPPAATPTSGKAGDEAAYRLSMVELKQRLHRDLPPTTVWGFDDGTSGPRYPGPTIEARAGKRVQVTWVNALRDESGAFRATHVLPVDHCVHGAGTDAPRTVIHLHGGHVPSDADGHPESTLLPGQEAHYRYPNLQDAATLWYHDHALGITRLNVYMGLAGFYLLRSDEEEALKLPSGKHDVPLVLQDRSFFPDGRLRYPSAWMEHFFGDTILVNGKVWPYLEVDRGRYRFRVLNGSGSRTYTLALSNGESFLQIGTDGGLLPAPVRRYSLTLAPGERAELLLDFTYHSEGDALVLQNSAPAPFPNGGTSQLVKDVMKLVVTGEAGDTGETPGTLRQVKPLLESSAVVTRDLELRQLPDACGGSSFHINGMHFDDLTELPHLGTTEVWRFVNRSGVMHPMHLHLVQVQVLDRQPFRLDGEQVVPVGDPTQADLAETGWKDTVQVQPFQIVRVIARFEDFAGRFPYHCHVLEHEDHDMMRQFEVVNRCGDGALARGAEECDDGNDENGDGCSETCRVEVVAGVDAGADASTVPPPPPTDAGIVAASARGGGGCSCRAAPARSARRGVAALAAMAALLGARRARRRSGPSAAPGSDPGAP